MRCNPSAAVITGGPSAKLDSVRSVMHRLRHLLGLGVVVVVAAAGCSESKPAQIAYWEAGEQATEIVVIGGCNEGGAKAEVVSETDQRVVIELTVSGEYLGDCADSTKVTLRRPLGDRQVVDATTDKPVRRAGDLSSR